MTNRGFSAWISLSGNVIDKKRNTERINHQTCYFQSLGSLFHSLLQQFLTWPLPFQVNSVSMQGATHHEAVAALRNAGCCIKLKVLRERLPPSDNYVPTVPQDPLNLAGRLVCQMSKPSQLEESEKCLPKKIEAVVCNGNSAVGVLTKFSAWAEKNLLKSDIVLQLTIPTDTEQETVNIFSFLYSWFSFVDTADFFLCVSVWFWQWSEQNPVWNRSRGIKIGLTQRDESHNVRK